jgi:hypothetical protein
MSKKFELRPLRDEAYLALLEALRRYLQFHSGCPLTSAWTGLGPPSAYKVAVEFGLMEYASDSHNPHPTPKVSNWWRLTPLGAGIVAAWIGAGYTAEKLGHNDNPPRPLFPVPVQGRSKCGSSSCTW